MSKPLGKQHIEGDNEPGPRDPGFEGHNHIAAGQHGQAHPQESRGNDVGDRMGEEVAFGGLA